MNIERLSNMADMLEEIDGGTWLPTDERMLRSDWQDIVVSFEDHDMDAPPDPGRLPIHFDLEDWMEVNECGFCACAVGHALMDERFTLDGFGLPSNGLTPVYSPNGEDKYRGWHAVKHYFGITTNTANHLFSAYEYEAGKAGPWHVAARIRELIASA